MSQTTKRKNGHNEDETATCWFNWISFRSDWVASSFFSLNFKDNFIPEWTLDYYHFFRFTNRFSDMNSGIVFAFLLFTTVSVISLFLQMNIVITLWKKKTKRFLCELNLLWMLLVNCSRIVYNDSAGCFDVSCRICIIFVMSYWRLCKPEIQSGEWCCVRPRLVFTAIGYAEKFNNHDSIGAEKRIHSRNSWCWLHTKSFSKGLYEQEVS